MRLELEASGYSVKVANSVEDGLPAARSGWASVLVVDRMLSGADGLSIVETLRQEGDVDTRPGDQRAVVGRRADQRAEGWRRRLSRQAVRRSRTDARGSKRCSGVAATRAPPGCKSALLEMDLVERKVRCAGRPVDLLPREFKLLEYFMRRPGQIVTRAMLLEDVWNFKFMAQTNVVDVQIGNLRRKLDPTGSAKFIVNVRAVGFRLDADD